MNLSSAARDPVEVVAEEFLERCRRGERPDISEYTSHYPELAEQIRDLFPTLAMMEEVRPGEGDGSGPGTGTGDGRGAGGAHPKLERLGEYRILREVGHGGMGIVYEAEQESLGRHVALKVLLTHSLLDPKQLYRFQREARAAARLHHSNIVPVHGVGQHDGLHFYIMQFIQGQGLDQVLAELKRLERLQEGSKKPTGQLAGSAGPGNANPTEGSAAAVAEGLLTGRFAATALFSPGQTGARQPPPGVLVEGSEPQRSEHAPPTPAGPDAHAGQSSVVDSTSSTGIHLPGQSEHSALSHSSSQYFQSVARIGMQVADALAYAHGQGILHRDIKPSNLLLDTQGTVWVTDFGLAKAAAEQDNLTHTGDIVGTLRYMAPERFKGEADVRSDLYSLGLTLYELLTLRPAFDEHDRNKLIQQVIHEEPPRLRTLNPAAPRDLETIVLKAIARDPAQRYQTPAALADDLKRFVEDRPIRARRVSPQERFWRWCRRNPGVAGLAAAAQIALVALLVVTAWSHMRISNALTDKEQALDDKDRALADKEEALGAKDSALSDKDRALSEREAARAEAVKLRDAAIAQTYRALLSETRALLLAHGEGWRYKALQKLENLAHLDTPQRDIAELRSEAIACLGEFDAHEIARFVGHTHSVWSLDFNADGSLLATAGYDGRLQIWDVREARQVRAILDPAVDLTGRYFDTTLLPAVRFRPDGNFLAYATWPKGVGIAGLVAGQETPTNLNYSAPARYLAFDKKGGLLAVSGGDGLVSLFDAESRLLKRTVQTNVGKNWYFPVALNHDGSLLAAMGPQNAVQLHFLAEDKEPITLGRHRDTVRSLCFSPSGHLLASASQDNSAKLWDTRGNQDPITLVGHGGRVNSVAFHPDGTLAASSSDDQTVRLWDTRTGQSLMVLNPRIGAILSVAFNPEGTWLAAGGSTGAVCLYQLTSRQEQRLLAGHNYVVHALAFHPSKPILASGSSDKDVILWDLQKGELKDRWQGGRQNPIAKLAFAPHGGLLAVGVGTFGTASGADYAVELREVETGKIMKRLVGPQKRIEALTFDAAGKLLAVHSNKTTFVWRTPTGDLACAWQHPALVRAAAFLSSGAQIVTADAAGRITIRDLTENRTLRERSIVGVLSLAVAPDERSLAVGDAKGTLRILTLPGLETSFTLEKAHAGPITLVAFSPDGRLLASYGTGERVILWDAQARRQLCGIPQRRGVNSFAFDSDSLRLAIAGVEETITLWNLALVRPGLAAIGLDWDGTLPQVALQAGAFADVQPPPAVKTVRVSLQPVKVASKGGPADSASRLEALYRQGQYQALIPLAETAIKADPGFKAYYVSLGNAHYQLGHYEQGLEAARRHLDLCPNCSWAVGKLASCHVALNAHPEAIRVLDQALQANPNLPGACNSLAWIYANGPENVRDPEKALPLAQRAVTLLANNATYLNTLGVTYFRQGKFEQAIETLQTASKLKGAKSTEALDQFFLGMTFQRLGQPEKAKECYDAVPSWSAAKLDPYAVRELEATRAEAAALLGIEVPGK